MSANGGHLATEPVSPSLIPVPLLKPLGNLSDRETVQAAQPGQPSRNSLEGPACTGLSVSRFTRLPLLPPQQVQGSSSQVFPAHSRHAWSKLTVAYLCVACGSNKKPPAAFLLLREVRPPSKHFAAGVAWFGGDDRLRERVAQPELVLRGRG